MKTSNKVLFHAFLLVVSAIGSAESALAAIGIDTELALGDSHIYSNCVFLVVTTTEPSRAPGA